MNLKKLFPLFILLALVVPAQAFAAPKPKVNFSRSAYAVAENDPSGVATITVVRKTHNNSNWQALLHTPDKSGFKGHLAWT